MKYPNSIHRACKSPPQNGATNSGFHVFLKRLIYSFNTNFKWAILQVVLIGVILTSTTFYIPSANLMNSVTDFSGESIVLIVYRTGYDYIKLNFQEYYLVNHDYLVDEAFSDHAWEKLFTENDVERLSSIQGVEQVLPCITFSCGMKNYNPDEFIVDRVEEWKNSILENETRRAQVQPYSDLLGLSLEEYLDYQHSFSFGVTIIALELDQILSWNLWLTDLKEGEYPKSPDTGLFNIHFKEMLNNLSIAEVQVGWHGRYNNSDEIQYYLFSNDLSIPISGYINSEEPTIVMGLNPFLTFLENIKQENSVTLPSYTDVYITLSHPLDHDKVTHEIKRVFPDVEIKMIGTAPSAVTQQYQASAQLSERISLMTFLLLGNFLVVGKLYENYLSRKQIWLFKSRGWGVIELISYSLTRNAILGVLGSTFAAILVILGKNLLVSSIFPPTLAQISPTISTAIAPALYQLVGQNAFFKLPFMGVMLAVTTDALALTYLIYTNPPSVREEK